jgi:hypothetical protein
MAKATKSSGKAAPKAAAKPATKAKPAAKAAAKPAAKPIIKIAPGKYKPAVPKPKKAKGDSEDNQIIDMSGTTRVRRD